MTKYLATIITEDSDVFTVYVNDVDLKKSIVEYDGKIIAVIRGSMELVKFNDDGDSLWRDIGYGDRTDETN